MKNLFLFFFILFFNQILLAQADCPCCSSHHTQFDFWIGDWLVYDSLGKELGQNLVLSIEDHCILNENWTGSKGSTGRSYNYFNKADSTWNQLWVDSKESHLELKGSLVGKNMILKSDLVKGEKVDFYYNQITWSPNKDKSVTQIWEIFDKEGNLLQEAFRGIYKRREQVKKPD